MTLVEVLVALVILLLVSLAVMQTAIMSIDSNASAALREEAIRIAEQRMNDANSLVYNSANKALLSSSVNPCPPSSQNLVQSGASDTASLTSTDCPSVVFRADFSNGWVCKRNVGSLSNFSFFTNSTVTDRGTYAQVSVTVGWQWKGNDYRHSISTIRRMVILQ
jgi:type II secretory pathway pseudopilin PulG